MLALALMLPASAARASESDNYLDDFGSGGYSGNDGSLDFGGPWSEFGDTGGPATGQVHIGAEYCSNNRCLHIEGGEGLDPGLILTSFGVSRAADLSMFESAELCFDVQVIPQEGITTAQLWVQVYNGSRWYTIKEIDLSEETSFHKTLNITEYMNPGFKVRFEVPSAVEAGVAELLFNGYATIDRVEISGLVKQSTTTTSTTSSTTTTTTPKASSSTSSTTSTSTSSTSTTTTTLGSVPETTSPRAAIGTRPEAVTGDGDAKSSTTTTVADTTTTSEVVMVVSPPTSPPGSGMRDPGIGLMSDYASGMMGDMEMESVEVLGAELEADFLLAAEYVESAKLWIALLALVVGAAFVGGLDRRRSRREVV